MSKQQILDGYLNTSWFGRGTYGVQRAAKAYYGKDVSQLNASEGAFLASLLKGAGLYDPALSAANHERAVDRWKWVLDRMVDDRQALGAPSAPRTPTFPEPQPPPRPAGLTGADRLPGGDWPRRTSPRTAASPTPSSTSAATRSTRPSRSPQVDALAAAVTRRLAKACDPARAGTADRDVRVGAASRRPRRAHPRRSTAAPTTSKQGFNDANVAIVPVGTAFTPFVYAAGAARRRAANARHSPVRPVTPSTALRRRRQGDRAARPRARTGAGTARSCRARNDGGRS